MNRQAVIVPSLAPDLVSGCDYEDVNPTTWNGKKVYLSPSHHGVPGGAERPNVGCGGFNENENAPVLAYAIHNGINNF